jgi:hypothetical protein
VLINRGPTSWAEFRGDSTKERERRFYAGRRARQRSGIRLSGHSDSVVKRVGSAACNLAVGAGSVCVLLWLIHLVIGWPLWLRGALWALFGMALLALAVCRALAYLYERRLPDR